MIWINYDLIIKICFYFWADLYLTIDEEKD